MTRRILLAAFALMVSIGAFAQDNLTAKVDLKSHMLLFTSPDGANMTVDVYNPGEKKRSGKVQVNVLNDEDLLVRTFSKKVSVGPRTEVPVYVEFPLRAGFYRVEVSVDEGDVQSFSIGYDADRLVLPVESKPDVAAFWDKAKGELAAIEPQYEFEVVPEACVKTHVMYKVMMKSLGGKTVYGYYCEPVCAGKVPCVVSFLDRDEAPRYAEIIPGCASFLLPAREQDVDLPREENYRRMYMDFVRAMDFVSSRDKVDQNKLISSGGAFAAIAAALDHRIDALCTESPVINAPQAYVLKNFIPMVECPVLMAFGMQDDVDSLYEVFTFYNNVKSEKSLMCCDLRGRDVRTYPAWEKRRLDFISRFVGATR